MPKKKELLIILILAVLVAGGIFAYFTLIIKEKGIATPEEIDSCSRRTVTKLVINTDERPAFVKDWIYCFGKECVPADEFLKECNNRYVTLSGKLSVEEICPSCYPEPCGCIVNADIFGITLRQIDDNVKKKYEDVGVYIKGVLHWEGPGYGPTLDVLKIKRSW